LLTASLHLHMRPGPGTVYEPPIRDLRGGTQLKPLAFNPIGYPEPEWVHVEVQGSGEKGWVRFTESYVVCNLDVRKFADVPAPPTPTVPAPVAFNVWAEPEQIEEGGCASIGWEIRNVQQADLNGEGIEIGQSQKEVCPTTSTSYKWRIIKRDGSQEEKTVTVAVIPKPDMHSISNVTLDPPSPASLNTGQDVRVAFKYSTTEAGGVYIWARPVANGVPAPDYAASGSPLYPAGEGNGSGTFSIESGAVTVDQIRFQIWNADKSQLLYEFFVPVSYTFSEGAAGLTAPTHISPADGSVFDHFPRTTRLRWSAVPGAAKYVVQIDCYHCCEAGKWCTDVGRTDYGQDEVTKTEYTFDFVGAQPGRWRVWAIGADGQEGPKSDWWEFRYTS
ncbi:MAG: hypothetical protein P8186_23050, partial [Anaerolineae bacterium]